MAFDLIKICNVLSCAVYKNEVPEGYGITGSQTFECKETDTEGMAYLTDDALYIAIQGSASLHDWLGNTRVIKTDFHGIRAHRGFAVAAESVLVDVMQLIARNPRPKTVLTGHSLGGAIAVLLAVALRPKEIDVVTFGQPCVATKAELNLAMFGSYVRVVNGSDIVPRLPRFGYSHAGTCLYLSNTGKRMLDPGWLKMFYDRTFTLRQSERGSDHFSNGYTVEYDKCVELP